MYNLWLLYQIEFWFSDVEKAKLSRKWEKKTHHSIVPTDFLK